MAKDAAQHPALGWLAPPALTQFPPWQTQPCRRVGWGRREGPYDRNSGCTSDAPGVLPWLLVSADGRAGQSALVGLSDTHCGDAGRVKATAARSSSVLV